MGSVPSLLAGQGLAEMNYPFHALEGVSQDHRGRGGGSLHNKGGLHATANVGLAIVGVAARNVELLNVGFALIAKLVLHRNGVLVYALRDAILLEDDIVRATLADLDLVGNEDELSAVGAHLHRPH